MKQSPQVRFAEILLFTGGVVTKIKVRKWLCSPGGLRRPIAETLWVGCSFNHDHPNLQKQQSGSGRGKFNVDSPSFTPATPPKKTISPNAADAAPFTPKHSAGNTLSRANSGASRADVLGAATPPVAPQFQDPNNGYAYGFFLS